MEDPKTLLLYVLLVVLAISYVRKVLSDSKIKAIPIVGPTGFLASYNYLAHASQLIQQGYNQYPDGIFRVAQLFRWEFVVCGPKFVNEVASAPEHVLSFREGVDERIQGPITLGRAIGENPYHQITIRTSLTRNLHRCFPDVRDEIVCAFDDVLSLQGNEWKTLPVLPITMRIVARVSNRLFVGLPICRDPAFLRNSVEYTINVFQTARRINVLPGFLRPILGPLMSNRKKSLREATRILGPLVAQRLEKENELGPDWPGKPNDLISWLLEIAEDEERTVPALVQRILVTNMAAIHTSSMAFTHALFDLTTYPSHLLPMREEVERVVKEEGWSKAALNNMVKVDSFLRESQRLSGTGPTGMMRGVVDKKGFYFSDGTYLPYGSFVSVAARPAHYDPSNYDDPAHFDGFRFAKMRQEMREERDHDQEPTKDIFKRHMVSTAVDHLSFGHGKHACPGRFFAATELKAMMAHVVLNYDMKAEVEGVRPPNDDFGTAASPSRTGRVSFRKRQ
ncbi:cytochrome P450 [Mycena sp. CBHHK59/15]|nr:cytochrome P450 [Mycena sp. CBHHK59/15]